MGNSKRDSQHLLLLIFGLLLITFLAFGDRRYIYSTVQHSSAKIGINVNNIATNSYVKWIKSQSDEFELAPNPIFLNKPVAFKDIVASQTALVLGQQTGAGDQRWIEIDLSDQRLYMKEGATTVGNFLVSTGKWAPTPVGEWRIWIKLRYTRMQGGSKALGTYYNLPNVPYTMYYYQGYGIHGAYWHNNFGNPMSHGCVNMKPEEAGIVFNWASVGTRVVVHE
ncbi:L,D-transpeptidase [Candidatus Curtissbacteria bacterium]|nr:L,D-transpeptidase [Candidatus Curtissbacteria bacterium]